MRFLFLSLLCFAFASAQADNYDALAQRLGKLSSMEIKEVGKEYARNEDWTNALYCFQMVVSRYKPGQSSREDAVAAGSAWNNLGYVYFYGRADYAQAFQCYLQSQEIALKIDDREMLPYIDLNLANVYALYRDEENALKHYRSSFNGACQLHIDEIALTSFCQLLIHSIDNHKQAQARRDIDRFRRQHIKRGTPGLRYATLLSNACTELINGHTNEAIASIAAIDSIDEDVLTLDRFKGQCLLLQASLLRGEGKLAQSIDVLRSVAPGILPDDIRVSFLELESDLLAAMGHPDSSIATRTIAMRINDSLYRTQTYGRIRDLSGDWEARRAAEQLQESDERRAQLWHWFFMVLMVAVVVGALAVQVVLKNRRLRQSNEALYQRINEANEQYEAMRRQIEAKASVKKTEEAEALDVELLAKVTDALADEEAIAAEDFTIDRLAKMIGSNSTYVSRVVNAGTGKNFAALLGEARVRLACRRLVDPNYAQFTIEGIAAGLGFKSRTNFIAVFKRITGLTPTEYKKIGLKS